MAVLTGLTYALIVSIFGFVLFYLYVQRRFKYWKGKNVPQAEPKFPMGNCQGMGSTTSIGLIVSRLYKKYKNEKFVGMYLFWNPVLVVNDLNLIKNILVKDFNHFHDRGITIDTDLEPLGGHLFAMNGQEWRNLRIKLTPTFTSGKMKMMFPIMVNVGEDMKKVLDEPATEMGIVEIKDILARYTTDVISSCAFGLDVSSLKNPDSEFRKVSLTIIKPGIQERLAQLLMMSCPKLLSILKLRMIPKKITDFFINAVRDTMNYREENNYQRNDFLQLLIQLRKKGYIEDADAPKNPEEEFSGPVQPFTFEQAAAQCFIFFFAGFETSSSTMQFSLYELAINPDLQKKLRSEIDRILAKYDGKLTYEGIQEMDLLDRVVAETLRKYPIATSIIRQCNKDYQIPGTDVIIEKDTMVLVPTMGIHRNPDYYPNPKKFDPDRFLPEEKEKRDHFAYIPFGEGPRNCIGMRFGLLQSKVGLAILLANYEFEVSEKTEIPIKLDPKVDLLMPLNGTHLRVKKRVISEL